jgi:hypothetical protein
MGVGAAVVHADWLVLDSMWVAPTDFFNTHSFLSPSTQMPEQYLRLVMTASFHIFPFHYLLTFIIPVWGVESAGLVLPA